MLTGDDDAHALGVVLRAPRPAKHLHHVQGAQLLPVALGRVVHLGPLDDDGVSRQVHTPRQGGSRHQHLQRCSGGSFTADLFGLFVRQVFGCMKSLLARLNTSSGKLSLLQAQETHGTSCCCCSHEVETVTIRLLMMKQYSGGL